MAASRRPSSALALPLSPAGKAVRATTRVSADFGTPISCSSKPFRLIGWSGDEGAGAVDRRQRAGRVDQAVAVVAEVVGEGDGRRQVGIERRAHRRPATRSSRCRCCRRPVVAGHRRGGGDAARDRRAPRAMSRAAVETGCSRKRSRAAGSGGGDVDPEAVDDVAARRPCWLRAVGEPRQPVAGRPAASGRRSARSRSAAAGSAVDDGDADARARARRCRRRTTRPARRRPWRCSTTARPTGAPIDSSGAPMALGVPRSRPSACWALRLAGDRRGQLAEQAARIGEVVVLEAQQAGDRAAGDEAVGEGARRRRPR